METQRLILVVDDDQIVRMLVGRILDQAGYRCLVVSGAQEALSALESQHPDIGLVLTDIVMPGASGLALGAQIAERWPEIPVVYMSGYTPEVLRQRGVELPDSFITKPFTIEELVANVAATLGPSPLERRGGQQRPGDSRTSPDRRSASPLS
jgi:two-component system, cell cycle sensor histidine kinase and response regulator CckA